MCRLFKTSVLVLTMTRKLIRLKTLLVGFFLKEVLEEVRRGVFKSYKLLLQCDCAFKDDV